ncbi:MAG: glycoside hydrolase family 15 protein [Chloroflexi bacterium]|nr:glycoside hydrolase family 15 protein [Chloroflexota bacterium]
MAARYAPIGEYAIIGDCRTAGLVSRDGSLDFLSLPRFDSPTIFAALLDADAGGRFRVRPVGSFRSERSYRANTSVLETTFIAAGGTGVLRDLMPVMSEDEKRTAPLPEHLVLRELEGLEGTIDIEVLYEPRPNYARQQPRIESRGALGFWIEIDGAACVLRSDVPLTVTDDGQSAVGTYQLQAGERIHLVMAYSREGPSIVPLLGLAAREHVERSIRWWQAWSARGAYDGPYRDAVIRSALTLKLMTCAPSGAVIAAPTTSLPEAIGGARNWDYRYCWLRDASLTLRALFALGYDEEATAFLDWMLHATRLTSPELQVMYDVFGESRVQERELLHLEGYAGSRPVRIGNGAQGQLQLDVYGEVIDAVAMFARRGGRFSRDTVKLLDSLGHTVCKRWREPDEGIWEGRSGRSHNTHSKVLCWVALDRLVRMHEAGSIQISVDEMRTERDAVRVEIEARGFSDELGSYTRTFDGNDLDASLLTLPYYGYVDGADPRMRSTCARIRERLGHGALVYRYQEVDDGLPSGEGAFGITSFWAVECLARGGDLDGATAAFEELLGFANDVGLYGEEIDPTTGSALGSFPQAFTHVGLIHAALTLAEARDGRRRTGPSDTATAINRESRL